MRTNQQQTIMASLVLALTLLSCSESGYQEECRGTTYNPDTHFCYYGNGVYPKCGGDYYEPDREFCSGNSVYDKCEGKEYSPSSQRCSDTCYDYYGNGRPCGHIETKCGSDSWYDATSSDFRCQNSTLETRCGSYWYNVAAQFCRNSTVKDYDGSVVYSGQTYNTVVIGTQTWMAKNLNYNASESKCYDNQESNCDKYGRLYDWQTAMTVCPSGWHIPSYDEWETLTDYVDGSATKLKAMNGWNYYNGTDDYGFSALPGGVYEDGYYFDAGWYGDWWSSTEYYSYEAYVQGMSYDYNDIDSYYRDKDNYLSVRCVKD